MNKLKQILEKYWSTEKANIFCETLEKSVPLYKIECLEIFIEDIFTINPKISSSDILSYTKNMDAFFNSEEFLIDFFKCTKTIEGDLIASKLENNPLEVERLINELLKKGKIKFKENENQFIVWYL
ncbi:MAG: hypothetical protein ACRDB6_09015 [Cetobacterium sp.]